MGAAALARGAVHEALQHYREQWNAAEGFEWLQVDARRSMGEAYLALGDVAQAKQHLRTALNLAVRIEALEELLDTLRAVARLAAASGESGWAVGVLAHILAQPDNDVQIRAKAKRLLAELAPGLPPEVVDAAKERGQGKTRDTIVQESLQMLGS